MNRRRWLVLGAVSIVVIAGCITLIGSSRNDRFEPSARSYFELACGLHGYQRDMGRAEIEHDQAERELAYAQSSLLLEVGNRKLDKRLQDLADSLSTALDENDDKAFDAARGRIDGECEGSDEFSPEPDRLIDVTCGIGNELKPGPGQEVELVVLSHLAYAAADNEKKYDALAKKAAHLVIPPPGQDPATSGHPTKRQITDFHKTCRAAT